MIKLTTKDRVAGAIMGAFIADAMALGPHWYYDLDELHKDYGKNINTYTKPKDGRYHEGLEAGSLSQSGFILKMLISSLVENEEYQQEHFCELLDKELFPLMDGTPMSGPGGYTSQSMREVYKQRVLEKKEWKNVKASRADTTEAIERNLAISIRYAFKPKDLALNVVHDTNLTQGDDMLGAMTVAYGAVLAQMIQGHKLDENISDKLMRLSKKGDLPFHVVTQDNLQPPKLGEKAMSNAGLFASPDALLTPSYMARAANDPDIKIEPAWKVSLVYAMPCAIYHMLPASYYLASRFKDNFEEALFNAINGGGQNMARAILTSTLVGAQVGISGIPSRLINGLQEKNKLLALAFQLADLVEKENI